MNRSIQAEGSFAQVKHDMNFKRFMCRGQKNVLAESILLAIAHNVNKLHNKIQYNRTDKPDLRTVIIQLIGNIYFNKKIILKNIKNHLFIV